MTGTSPTPPPKASGSSWWERAGKRISVIAGALGLLATIGGFGIINPPVLANTFEKLAQKVSLNAEHLQELRCGNLQSRIESKRVRIDIKRAREDVLSSNNRGIPLDLKESIRRLKGELDVLLAQYKRRCL